jgi:hypothetical protein
MIAGRVGLRRVRHLRWSINGLKKKDRIGEDIIRRSRRASLRIIKKAKEKYIYLSLRVHMTAFVILFVMLIFTASGISEINRPTSEQCKKANVLIARTRLELIIAESKGPNYDYQSNKRAIDLLDTEGIEVIKGLDKAPAFQQATKDFVITAREYFNNSAAKPGESRMVYSARTSALKTRLDQATERVDLESKLACPE